MLLHCCVAILCGHGVKPDTGKAKAIAEMIAPTNKKETRKLMGMVNYLNEFIRNLSELCAPI